MLDARYAHTVTPLAENSPGNHATHYCQVALSQIRQKKIPILNTENQSRASIPAGVQL